MQESIKIVSLNIEKDRHFERIVPFLVKEKFDVVCLQELLDSDIALFEKTLSASCVYTPMSRRLYKGRTVFEGIGIFSTLPIREHASTRYAGNPDHSVYFDAQDQHTEHETQSYELLRCDVRKGETTFRVVTTHFTWTPGGTADEVQRVDMENVCSLLAHENEFVLCGDFNAPRGGEIFQMLAGRYTDQVPAHYTSSIDGTFHRAGALPLMVDGFFTTKKYTASDVHMHCGLSDHCALVGTVTRK